MQANQLTIHSLRKKLDQKEVSSQEITQHLLERIQKYDSSIGSYLELNPKALELAQAYDNGAKDPNLTLGGIPLSPKDIYLTKGIKTTCASKILANYVAPYNGTAIQNCLDQGAIILGKVNLDEFAMGSSNETSAFKNCVNPWNFDYVPGGSSGGSAASVAAGLAVCSLGTDTGGSIRQPAALCGIVGLKPTYGRVSRFGVIAYASSLDQMGPMTRDVTDCATLLNIIAGFDEKDSTSVDQPVPDYTQSLNQPIKGLKIGVPKQYFEQGLEDEVKQAVLQAIKDLEKDGAKIVEVDLAHTEYAIATYYVVACAEASSNLARYDGVRFGFRADAQDLEELYQKSRTQGFGQEVKRRIVLGTYVLSSGYYDAYYIKAQKVRRLITNDFTKAFENVDLIVGPTTPTTSFKIGAKLDDPLAMYLSDVLTVPVNLAGLPAMSLPCGFDSKGLPIGLQIIGPHFGEQKIFTLAHHFENSHDYVKQSPSHLS